MGMQSWNRRWAEEIGNTEEKVPMMTIETGMKSHCVITYLRVGMKRKCKQIADCYRMQISSLEKKSALLNHEKEMVMNAFFVAEIR